MTPEGKIHYSKGIHKIVKNYRGQQINSAYYKSSKQTDRLHKQTARQNKVEKKANKALLQYSKDAKEYNLISKKLDKAENGISAKLIGTSGRKIRKLERSLDKQKNTMDISKNNYDIVQAKAVAQKYKSEKIARVANAKREKAGRKANKYIDRYSREEYRKLYDKYPKLQYYQNYR